MRTALRNDDALDRMAAPRAGMPRSSKDLQMLFVVPAKVSRSAKIVFAVPESRPVIFNTLF
jgi:hypothetical protein